MATSLRKSFRLPRMPGRRYNILEGKENAYFNTPKYKRAISEGDIPMQRHAIHPRPLGDGKPKFERNTNLTKSVREAVCSLKQRFKTSTRKLKRLTNETKSPSPLKGVRRSNRSVAGSTPPRASHHEVKMYSPFMIDTPNTNRTPSRIRTNSTQRWRDNMETPTRLKREVEALTANMQALATLTPGTLQQRPKTRRSSVSPLTNGSLRTRPPGVRSSERIQSKQQRIRTLAIQ